MIVTAHKQVCANPKRSLCLNHLLKSHLMFFDVFCYFSTTQLNPETSTILAFFVSLVAATHPSSPPSRFRFPVSDRFGHLGIVLPLFCLTHRAIGCIRMHRINFGEVLSHVEGYLGSDGGQKMVGFFFQKNIPSCIAATKKHCDFNDHDIDSRCDIEMQTRTTSKCKKKHLRFISNSKGCLAEAPHGVS